MDEQKPIIKGYVKQLSSEELTHKVYLKVENRLFADLYPRIVRLEMMTSFLTELVEELARRNKTRTSLLISQEDYTEYDLIRIILRSNLEEIKEMQKAAQENKTAKTERMEV